jgi:hypothetical protein
MRGSDKDDPEWQEQHHKTHDQNGMGREVEEWGTFDHCC